MSKMTVVHFCGQAFFCFTALHCELRHCLVAGKSGDYSTAHGFACRCNGDDPPVGQRDCRITS